MKLTKERGFRRQSGLIDLNHLVLISIIRQLMKIMEFIKHWKLLQY